MRICISLPLLALTLVITPIPSAYAQTDESSSIALEPIRQRSSPAFLYTVSIYGSACMDIGNSFNSAHSSLHPTGSKFSPGASFEVKLPIENIPVINKLYIGTSLGIRYSYYKDDSYNIRIGSGLESPFIKTWSIEPDLHLTLNSFYYGKIGYAWSYIFNKSIESHNNPMYIGIDNDCINTMGSFFYFEFGIKIKNVIFTAGGEISNYCLFDLNRLYDYKRISYQARILPLNIMLKLYVQIYSNHY